MPHEHSYKTGCLSSEHFPFHDGRFLQTDSISLGSFFHCFRKLCRELSGLLLSMQKTHFISHALIFYHFPPMNKAFKGWEMRWEMPQKVRATALTKPKNVLLCNLGTEHLFLFGSVKIYAWNYWITDTLIVLNSIPAVISLLFFSKRKGGKDILRFPIKGDDSVNRVNNSVVELSGKYSLSNDRW